jgi:hypothetical protein
MTFLMEITRQQVKWPGETTAISPVGGKWQFWVDNMASPSYPPKIAAFQTRYNFKLEA